MTYPSSAPRTPTPSTARSRCTPDLTAEQCAKDYEYNTGRVIVDMLAEDDQRAAEVPAALVASHGPFTWGASARKSLEHADHLRGRRRDRPPHPGPDPTSPAAPSPPRPPLHPQTRPRRLLRQPGSHCGFVTGTEIRADARR